MVCLGVGGLVDLGSLLGLDEEEGNFGAIEVWVVDARRPWNLGNVFGGCPAPIAGDDGEGAADQKVVGIEEGKITRGYKPGKGGIIVFDDGDIEEDLEKENSAYLALVDMPQVEEGDDSEGSDTESEDEAPEPQPGQKRKSWSDQDDEDDSDDDRPRQRRRSNSVRLYDSSSIVFTDMCIVQSYPRITTSPSTARAYVSTRCCGRL